jgi:hypothetical protein
LTRITAPDTPILEATLPRFALVYVLLIKENHMNMAYAVPDQTAIRYPQFSPEADMTPTDCLEADQPWASQSLIRWAQQPENEHYLMDIMFERNATAMRDLAIQAWDAQVRKGEWS